MDKFEIMLQLFAEGGDGGAAGAGEQGGGAENAQAPSPVGRKQRRENPLKNVQYGVLPKEDGAGQVAPDEVQEKDAPAKAAFEDLIKGEYKQDFDARVQEIIKGRFKQNAETEEKLGKVKPIVDLIAQKYNVNPDDLDALSKAVGNDDSLYEDEAAERGMSVESLKALRQIERENTELKEREQRSAQETMMRAHFDNLARQADAAKQLYPTFDLMAEMRNPEFARLTAPNVGVDVRTAYEVVHRSEMAGAEMQFAAQKSAERIASSVKAGSKRPTENGLNASQGASVVKTDPKTFDKNDRAEIRRRVMSGEKIYF